MKKNLLRICWALMFLAAILAAVFACLAIYFCLRGANPWPQAVAIITGALLFGSLVFPTSKQKKIIDYSVLFLIFVFWYQSIEPRMNANWQRDVATLPFAEINEGEIIINNVRAAEYRTETDFDLHYVNRVVHLSNLKAVDFFLSYWGSSSIAHGIMSFDFGPEGRIAISIETRKTVGQEYSSIKGFFKVYELIYIVSDERDVIGLRSNFRKEDVYLYRLKMPIQRAKETFLNYMHSINKLVKKPQFYNAFSANCTGEIFAQVPDVNPAVFRDWRVLANGHLDEALYAWGLVDTSLRMADLKAVSLINKRAQAGEVNSTFSERIRVGIPQPEPNPDPANQVAKLGLSNVTMRRT